MKNKTKHSKRVIGAPNTNKDRVIGEAINELTEEIKKQKKM